MTKNSIFNQYKKVLLVIFVVVLPLLFFITPLVKAATSKPKVLVISSYHIGFGGTDPMVEGIKRAFSKQNQNVQFYFEYLDSKRFKSDEIYTATEHLYATKYSDNNIVFDTIIVADNNALTFLHKLRNKIFPNIPIVFCGINNFNKDMLKGLSPITGVVEDISIKETVELALSLHPHATNLAVISDSTATGKANIGKFKDIATSLPTYLSIITLENLSAEELSTSLQSLPKDTIILQLSFYKDKNGKAFSQKEQMELITSFTDKPIYSAWDFFIDHGVLGGVVTFFPLQGEEAGNMAIRIIRGEPINEIPVVTTSPNVPLFDNNVLKEFKIKPKDLPKNSIIKNITTSFYDKHKVMVWIVAVFMLSQTIAITVLINAVRRSKRNEALLFKSEERFQLAMKASNDGLWDWHIPTGKVFYSHGYKEMIGYTDVIINDHVNTWLSLIHPEDKSNAIKENRKCIDNIEDNFQIEFRLKHNDGHWVWILGRGMAIERDTTGKALRIIGTHTDITRHKELEKELILSEEKLKESEEKYRVMMESMIDPVYICNLEKDIIYLNPAMIKRVGRNAVGEKCYKVLHGLEQECQWCSFFSTDKNEHYEMDIISPLDNRSYHVSSSPMIMSDDTFLKLTVYRDTTEMMKIQEQLQQVQKMEAIGNLAGGVAHDFNNILSPIIGMSELLIEKHNANDQDLEDLQEILKAGNRGKELVKQILTFSRQGKNIKTSIAIQFVIREALKLCRASIPSSVTIDQDIDFTIDEVIADSTQIHQVAMNLITNAFHAVEETSGTISVSLKECCIEYNQLGTDKLLPGRYIVFTVSDTGTGISSEIKEKIFEPYFTTKKLGKGTGLGLATTYGIVKDHGGNIRVQNNPIQGATFEVYLPVIKKTPSKINDNLDDVDSIQGTGHILMVDDEPPIVELNKRILENAGYTVTAENSSIKAFETFKEHPEKFDVILTDMAMPAMAGNFLIKEVRKIRPHIPVIVYTGYSEHVSPKNIHDLEVNGFLMKPVRKNELTTMIQKVLTKK